MAGCQGERERWLRGFISPFISPITPSLGGGIVTQQSLSKHRGWKKAATEVKYVRNHSLSLQFDLENVFAKKVALEPF